MDIRTKIGQVQFDVRTCGILFNQAGEVLVSNENDGSQTLSGGAVKIGESSEDALEREFMEETGLVVSVRSLVAVVENFFEIDEAPYQQVVFVYLLKTPENLSDIRQREAGVSAKWLDISKINLKPVVLNELVKHLKFNPNLALQHFINRDVEG